MKDNKLFGKYTLQEHINYLEPMFNKIQQKKTSSLPFTLNNLYALKKWLILEQVSYNKFIPELFEYFKRKL